MAQEPRRHKQSVDLINNKVCVLRTCCDKEHAQKCETATGNGTKGPWDIRIFTN